MATVALPHPVGPHRTFSMGLSRRAYQRLTMMGERFALWHTVEPRVDVWASAGALTLAGVATIAVLVLGRF